MKRYLFENEETTSKKLKHTCDIHDPQMFKHLKRCILKQTKDEVHINIGTYAIAGKLISFQLQIIQHKGGFYDFKIPLPDGYPSTDILTDEVIRKEQLLFEGSLSAWKDLPVELLLFYLYPAKN